MPVRNGALGLSSGLGDLGALLDMAHPIRDATAVLHPVKEITGWSVDQGTTYVASFEFVFDGIRRDITAVKTLVSGTPLTRQETLADCRSTAGSYFYDVEETFGTMEAWDDGVTEWDDGVSKWDQFPKLYVNLSDGSDPLDTTVVGVFSFHFANRGMYIPDLGPNIFTDGELDVWSSGTNLTNWSEILTSSGTVNQDQSDFQEGTSSARIDSGSGDSAYIRQSNSLVDGAMYRVSGYYKTDPGATGTADLEVFDGAVANWITEGGKDLDTNPVVMNLAHTNGVWRRFVFDFRCWSTGTMWVGVGGDGVITVRYDDLKLQRIWRYNYYEPRLSTGALPDIQASSSDIFFGGKSIGSGGVTLINADGMVERLVAELDWMNQEAVIEIGGQLPTPDGSDPTPLDVGQHFRQMTGLIQNINDTDADTEFELQDLRIIFHQKLPPRSYDDQVNPNLNPSIQGFKRPLFFGVKENITPNRIDRDVVSSYGIYEIADTDKAPNGIKAIDRVYAYLESQDATEKRTDRRLLLISGTDYTEDLANGQFTIDRDVGPYLVGETNNLLDFDEGGSELTATITEGMYTATALAAEIQTQIRAVGAADWTCAYSDATHKFTITKAAGTANLLGKTGTNKDIGIWTLIGFKKSTDQTGALTYTGTKATFTDAERDHFLRVDAQGYKDDASGTFTGSANALIEIGADILRCLLVQWMNKSAGIIDETSFTFARQRAPESLAIYLKEDTNTRDLFDKLEFSNIANIVVDGSGMVFYKVYVGDVPAGITVLSDEDFQDFDSGQSTNEIFATVRVNFDQDPTSGIFETRERTAESVALTFGRPEIKEFETFIKIGNNAISAAARYLELSASPARRVTGAVLGSKMFRLHVGDKFQLFRRRGLAVGGKISGDIFRIISLSKSALTGVVGFESTDDRVTVAAVACISSCQSFCESSCQTSCEIACQSTCQLGCETSCEVGCQEACQLGCQTACQLGCETACEANCQTTCQLSCQGACEGGGCQTNCETSCQTSCELACQTACQSSCQSTCQLGCQTGCETSCQSTCEQACQTTCELNCQQTCELNCQELCETSCQDSCESDCQVAAEDI